MKYIAWIPEIVKKIVGYSCTLFLLGWGAYDKFENKLNANNEIVMKQMRLERSIELNELKTEMAVMNNNINWIKTGVNDTNSKLDQLIRKM